jgi:hypothetical protein
MENPLRISKMRMRVIKNNERNAYIRQI